MASIRLLPALCASLILAACALGRDAAAAPPPEPDPGLEVGDVFRDCADCPEMVVVPSGSFMMGSPPSEEGRWDDEGPVHRVSIPSAFAVGVYEVTFEEWDACVSAGDCGGYRPSDWGWGRGKRPVINVSWEDAQAYVAWLSGETSETYRLLSEAEWEYVARAGTTTRYHWGDAIGRNLANCDGCGSRWDSEGTSPAGVFGANAFGLHDVHGNVWEWVEDCWNSSYAGAPNDGSVWSSGDCSRHVLRGGSWYYYPRGLRAASRGSAGNRHKSTGFRVARTVTPDDTASAAPPPEPDPGLEVGDVFRDCADCPEMVVVPSGSFMMGSPPSKEGRWDEEGPVHRVMIGARFAVGVYEVTFEEWDACVSAGGCGGYRPDDEGWGRGRRPVIRVSWEDAQAYVDWLSGETGEAYRLLSEAEWEYVARAGTTTRYHWGDALGRNLANCDGCGSRWDDELTSPVGSFGANAFGLHDVHGNVWEWVEDCWNDSYAGAPRDGSAWMSGYCSSHVLRGGSWSSIRGTSARRTKFWNDAGDRFTHVGFRVARMVTS